MRNNELERTWPQYQEAESRGPSADKWGDVRLGRLPQFLQSVSAGLPVSSLYLPSPHSSHTFADAASGWELHFPASQFLHLGCPCSLLYVPFKQFLQ